MKECAQQNCPKCAPLREDLTALEGNVAILSDAAQRLSSTLGRELLFLRALTSEPLSLERRDLYPLVRDAVRDLLALRFRDKSLKVEINGQPWEECRDSLTFSFEPAALEVMVQNLLSNAMKYGDHIRIDMDDMGSSVRLTIRDNGPGVDVAKLRRDLAAAGELREADSTRLGLRVSLHLLEKLGGRLMVASSPQAGAAFILEIPKHPGPRRG